ncbi:hypothetical protein LOC71_14110 [Rhodopirellula sp. JC740]|uniref:Uncharacterized protein n=1 Tax=Rhodopirellula halodulae TaxID=2894198 RepID=A0ABS8NIM9_9BACT|nr:hypothetical protein [Rhodopirellula sp. JC740]MCC9643415.1 hypothetical protein [Rhodopirellula sp. JC740]
MRFPEVGVVRMNVDNHTRANEKSEPNGRDDPWIPMVEMQRELQAVSGGLREC